jgi:hypothetical protein
MSAHGTKRHPDVEEFLAAIEDRLRALAVERRADEREERAQHLDLLVIACRARGMDEDAAARAAIEEGITRG